VAFPRTFQSWKRATGLGSAGNLFDSSEKYEMYVYNKENKI